MHSLVSLSGQRSEPKSSNSSITIESNRNSNSYKQKTDQFALANYCLWFVWKCASFGPVMAFFGAWLNESEARKWSYAVLWLTFLAIQCIYRIMERVFFLNMLSDDEYAQSVDISLVLIILKCKSRNKLMSYNV